MVFRRFIAAAFLAVAAIPSAGAQYLLNDILEPVRVRYGLPALAAAVAKNGNIKANANRPSSNPKP